MPVSLKASDLGLSSDQVEKLWQAVCRQRAVPDEVVVVRTVSLAQMRTLNQTYRGQDRPTNVLSFTYPPLAGEASEHEIILCPEVAVRQAARRAVPIADYTALLLIHGFLHAAGLDHERSADEAAAMTAAEAEILMVHGFTPLRL